MQVDVYLAVPAIYHLEPPRSCIRGVGAPTELPHRLELAPWGPRSWRGVERGNCCLRVRFDVRIEGGIWHTTSMNAAVAGR